MSGHNELIDRYIYDVVRRLPRGQRYDIEQELKALINDMVEAEGGNADIPAILNSLGKPGELANKYRDGKKYLIGPELYDTYSLLVKIIFCCTLFGVVVSIIVSWVTDPGQGGYFKQVLASIASIGASLLAAFGGVTLVFAVMEHKKIKIDLAFDKDWSLQMLPPVPSKKAIIKRSDTVVGIVFSLIFACLLLIAPRMFGAWVEVGGTMQTIPIFNMEVWNEILPVFLLSIGCTLIDEIVKLVVGRYGTAVAFTNVITGVLSIICSFILLKVLPLWNPSFLTELLNIHTIRVPFENLWGRLFENGVLSDFLLVIVVIATCLEMGVTIYKSTRYGKTVR